jgi:hypothetical protein
MQTVKIEADITDTGVLQLSEQYKQLYDTKVQIIFLLSESEPIINQANKPITVDLMKYSDTVDWQIDGIEFQRKLRDEWN